MLLYVGQHIHGVRVVLLFPTSTWIEYRVQVYIIPNHIIGSRASLENKTEQPQPDPVTLLHTMVVIAAALLTFGPLRVNERARAVCTPFHLAAS